MTTVQLRRYEFEPGRLADFLPWFPGLAPVRERFGFRLLFALADHERETFTWAVAHDGDEAAFTAAEQAYNESPERAEVFATFPAGIARSEIGFAEDVLRR
jgi:hypothetical protein